MAPLGKPSTRPCTPTPMFQSVWESQLHLSSLKGPQWTDCSWPPHSACAQLGFHYP